MALGKILREARERRQLTLSQVAAATRMKVQVAQALEAEDYRRIPAPIYGRGFIRMYAEFIGVDPKPLVAEYMAVVSGPVEQPVPPSQAPLPGKTQPVASVPPAPASGPTVPKAVPPAREPDQPRPESTEPKPAPAPPPAPVVPPPEKPVPVLPPPASSPPEPIAEVAQVEQREPEPPSPRPAAVTPAEPARRQADDLFSWGQAAAGAGPPPEQPVPRPPSPSAPESPAGTVPPAARVEPVEATPAGKAGKEPEPVSPPSSPAPGQKDNEDLFAAAASQPLARPPKTTLGPQPAAHLRRPLQRPEPGQEPRLSSEREALRVRTILVLIGIVVVAVFLISALTRCSTPQKEVKRGPIKEQLKMAVDPPAPYVD